MRAFAGRIIVSRRTTDPDPRVVLGLATMDKEGSEYATSVDVGLVSETYQFAAVLTEAFATQRPSSVPAQDQNGVEDSITAPPAVASIFVETVNLVDTTAEAPVPRRVIPPAALVEVSSPPPGVGPAARAQESLVALVLDQVWSLLSPLPLVVVLINTRSRYLAQFCCVVAC